MPIHDKKTFGWRGVYSRSLSVLVSVIAWQISKMCTGIWKTFYGHCHSHGNIENILAHLHNRSPDVKNERHFLFRHRLLLKQAIMDKLKSPLLKLRTRTLLTFENKSLKKAGQFADTDPTSSTLPTIGGILTGGLFQTVPKKG
jgi:hypothetical protein